MSLKITDNKEYYSLAHKLGVPEKGLLNLKDQLFGLEANFELFQAIDFKKGCYVGQEVVSRIKHRQLNRKSIIVFQNLSFDESKKIDNFEIIIKIKDFFIVRLPINTDFKKFENDYGLKKIDAT